MKKNQNHKVEKTSFPWWKGSIIYQIYPRSFFDSNNDGIGDLPGITKKLEYLASLHVDAIWVSPFYQSPMKDFGYDISDYQDVDPIFGNLNDFKKMIDKAKSLKLKVIIDQVLNHTSDQHSWFQTSRSSRTNSKSDWYVWADPKPDGSPPNNWLSIFGGSAWQWDPRREQYYFHHFLREQPDLNFYNPQVRKALLNTMEFWLRLGVDGFRLDTVNFFYHSRTLRNNPPRKPFAVSGVTTTNPYAYQRHLYDKTQPENITFLKSIRKLTERYSRPEHEILTLGEIGDDNYLQVMADYTRGKSLLHTCYGFGYLSKDFSAKFFKNSIEQFEKIVQNGWGCWSFSNHDCERVVSRWGKHFPHMNAQQKNRFIKMLLALQMTLKGSVCIYQGEELGLTEGLIKPDDLRDPYGIEMYPIFLGRDGCRTPMVWENQKPHAGFTKGKKPWLPIPPEHHLLNVETQENNPHSILEFTRKIFQFRKQFPQLLIGDISVTSTPKLIREEILVLKRTLTHESPILALFNLGNHIREYPLTSSVLRSSGIDHFCNYHINQGITINKSGKPRMIIKPFAFGFFNIGT